MSLFRLSRIYCLFIAALSLFGLTNAPLFAQPAMPLHTQQILEQLAVQTPKHINPPLLADDVFWTQLEQQHALKLLAYKSDQYNAEELKSHGIRIAVSVNHLLSLDVPLDALSFLLQYEGIRYLEIPAPIQPDLDVLVQDTRIDTVHQGIDQWGPYTGKDVIVGVIDWGYDFHHPMFYDSTLQRNRILGCWDHWKKSGPAPEPYGYGTEYLGTEELLNARSDTANNRGYDTHGTHVAGIAGGGGAGIGIKGMAPECDFLFVQIDWNVGTFLDAVDWMYRISQREQKRLVVNMSFGSYHRANLDTSSFFQDVIKAYSQRGVVMVTSAGNNGNNRMHFKKTFTSESDSVSSLVSMLPKSTTFPRYLGNRVIMWGSPHTSFSVAFSVLAPNNMVLYRSSYFDSKNHSENSQQEIEINNQILKVRIEGDSQNPLNQKPYMSFVFDKPNDGWRIVLHAKSNNATVHFWNVIQNTLGTSNTGMSFVEWGANGIAGDNDYTVSDPATSSDVITVAAHNRQVENSTGQVFPGVIAPFSSRGPTVDELIKPDVSAPGASILSAVSGVTTQNYELETTAMFNNEAFPFSRFSGTSMSGPAVAGLAAVLLEVNPNLSHWQVKEIIMQTAREDMRTGDLGALGDNTWGKGKITATQAVLKALESDGSFRWIEKGTVYPNPSNSVFYYKGNADLQYHASLINLEGKTVLKGNMSPITGLNVANLAPGVYFLLIEHENNQKEYHKVIVH